MVSQNILNKLLNFGLFQLLWFTIILGVASDMIWPALLAFLSFLIIHFVTSYNPGEDAKLIVISLVLGLILDSIWQLSGLIEYKHSALFFPFAPYWILLLWIAFAMTLKHSMQWVFQYKKLAIVFAALGGTLSYFAAERLGAIEILHPFLAMFFLSFSWAIVMAILVDYEVFFSADSSNKELPLG